MTQLPTDSSPVIRSFRRSISMIGAVLLVFALLAGAFWLSTRARPPEPPPAPANPAIAQIAPAAPATAAPLPQATEKRLQSTPEMPLLAMPASGILASVNGVLIRSEDLATSLAVDRAMYALGAMEEPPTDLNVLARLIDDELAWQAAIQAGYAVDSQAVEAQAQQLLARYDLSQEQLAETLELAGASYQEFLTILARLLVINDYLQGQVLAGWPADQWAAVEAAWVAEQRQQADIRYDVEEEEESPEIASVAEGSQTITEEVASTPEAAVVPRSSGEFQGGLEAGQMPPDFTAEGLTGQPVSLSSLRGRPLILTFWTTWCPFCRQEMPELQAAQDRYGADGLLVVAVNQKEERSLVERYIRDNDLRLTVALDPEGEIGQAYMIRAFPTSLLINPDGVIFQRQVGRLTPETIARFMAQ